MNNIRRKKENVNKTDQISSKKHLSVDEHEFVLEMVNMWINNADSKVSTFCAVFTIVFGVIALAESLIGIKIEIFKMIDSGSRYIALSMLCISLIAFAISIGFCLHAISPKLTGMLKKKELKATAHPDYSIFYGKISQFKDKDTYIKVANSALEEDYINEILTEIYVNSGICTKKMRKFQIGILMSYIAVISEIACFIFLFFAYSSID